MIPKTSSRILRPCNFDTSTRNAYASYVIRPITRTRSRVQCAALINVGEISNCRFEKLPGHELYSMIDMVTSTTSIAADIGTNQVHQTMNFDDAGVLYARDTKTPAQGPKKLYQTARVSLGYSPQHSDGPCHVIIASANPAVTDLLVQKAAVDMSCFETLKRETYADLIARRISVEQQPVIVAKKIADVMRMPLLVLIKPACSMSTRSTTWHCFYYSPEMPSNVRDAVAYIIKEGDT